MRFGEVWLASLLVTLAGLAAAGWGWIGLTGPVGEHPREISFIVIGLIAAGFGAIVWRQAAKVARRAARLRAGEGQSGRWMIAPEAIAALRAAEREQGIVNEWRPRPGERRRGVEVLWGGEDLLVGGTWWRIAQGQYPAIEGVRIEPGPPPAAVIAFSQLWSNPMRSVTRLERSAREFRFPASDMAGARAMALQLGQGLARPPRYDRARSRRWQIAALALAALFAAMGVAGIAVAMHDARHGIFRPDSERALLIAMMVLAVMGTPAALLLAALAGRMRRGG